MKLKQACALLCATSILMNHCVLYVNAETQNENFSENISEMNEDDGLLSSGTCGDHATWTLDEDGLLEIQWEQSLKACIH